MLVSNISSIIHKLESEKSPKTSSTEWIPEVNGERNEVGALLVPLCWELAQQCWGLSLLLPAVAWLEEDTGSWEKTPLLLTVPPASPLTKLSIFPAGEEQHLKGLSLSSQSSQSWVSFHWDAISYSISPYTNLEYVLFCWASRKYSSQNT